MMTKLKLASIMICGALLVENAYADDIGSVRKKSPEFQVTSHVGLFNLERCMIDTDNIGKPWVYRQPDLPERVMLVWESSDLGDATVLEMNGLNETKIRFWGRNKAWRKVQPCLEREVRAVIP